MKNRRYRNRGRTGILPWSQTRGSIHPQGGSPCGRSGAPVEGRIQNLHCGQRHTGSPEHRRRILQGSWRRPKTCAANSKNIWTSPPASSWSCRRPSARYSSCRTRNDPTRALWPWISSPRCHFRFLGGYHAGTVITRRIARGGLPPPCKSGGGCRLSWIWKFQRRRNAKNFPGGFAAAVSYCRLRGAKVYLTMNTLLHRPGTG